MGPRTIDRTGLLELARSSLGNGGWLDTRDRVCIDATDGLDTVAARMIRKLSEASTLIRGG